MKRIAITLKSYANRNCEGLIAKMNKEAVRRARISLSRSRIASPAIVIFDEAGPFSSYAELVRTGRHAHLITRISAPTAERKTELREFIAANFELQP